MPIGPTNPTPELLDSLTIRPTALSPEATVDSLRVGLEALFGPSASLVAPAPASTIAPFALTDNWVVGAMLIAIFVAYLFVLYAYGGYCGLMVKIILGGNIGIRVADELSYLYVRAVRSLGAIGIVVWACVALRVVDMTIPEAYATINPLLLGPILLMAVMALAIVARWLTHGVCWMVRRADLSQGINLLASTTTALVSLVATPIALCFVANMGSSAIWFGSAAIVVAAVGLLIFAIKSLIFFLEQKISILLWFLYLCTVVLIPIGIIITLVMRNGTA